MGALFVVLLSGLRLGTQVPYFIIIPASGLIAVAAPVCGTYTFGSQAKHWRAYGQCDCIYYHNTFLTDMSVVAALIAPRPLLLCSGQRDADFPPDGYHEVFRRAKQIYDLYRGSLSSSDRIREVDEAVGHTDSPLFRRETRQWMNRWLKGQTGPAPEPDHVIEYDEDLYVTKTGQVANSRGGETASTWNIQRLSKVRRSRPGSVRGFMVRLTRLAAAIAPCSSISR